MLKRLLIIAALVVGASPAYACISNHSNVTDSAGTTGFLMGLGTDANGNCDVTVDAPIGGTLDSDLKAALPVSVSSTPTAVTGSTVGSLTGAHVLPLGQYPATAVPYTASATGTIAATTATLTGAASVTTYICGFSIRANATAAVTGNATVTGTITGTLNFTQWTAPAASGLGVTEMIFTPCVPASAANTSIAVVSAAPGTGGVVSVTAWGYKL